MSFDRTRKLEGVIVGTKDIGEQDRLIFLFTPQEGRIRVLAKGIRKINSKRVGSLELGKKIKFLLNYGNNLDIITEVEEIGLPALFRKDDAKVSSLLLVCELVNSFLPEKEKNIEVYELFLKTLEEIEKKRVEAIVKFEFSLLKELGFGVDYRTEGLLNSSEWKKAHFFLKMKIEKIIEKPLKSLVVFR